MAVAARARTGAILLALAFVPSSVSAAHADSEVVAVDPLGAATPVLWNGGVAWEDPDGVRAVIPGSAPRRLVSFRALGVTYSYSLDSGIDSEGSGGTLAYGWEEANNMTPPMGPGDTRIPAPPLPYETSISHRGLIAADGDVTQLPDCATQDLPTSFGSYLISLAGTSVAYLCAGAPPGMQSAAGVISPSYLALSETGAPADPAHTIAQARPPFQISGDYIAYSAGSTPATSRIVVAKRDTAAVIYEVPQPSESARAIALGDDGTLVLLGAGTSTCPKPAGYSAQSFPAEWFSPSSPTAHELGCFYDGALRPVGGQWVALAPGPGTHASLVLITLATGSSRTLAVAPNAGMFEPQLQGIPPAPQTEPAADFDGHRLAWVRQTCAGTAVELTSDLSTISPGPLASTRCPVVFHLHGSLHPTVRGVVRVGMSCPLGCTITGTLIAGPHPLFKEGPAYFSLPASSRPTTETFHLTRRQLVNLRRRGHVRVVLSAEAAGLGYAPDTRTAVHITLAAR